MTTIGSGPSFKNCPPTWAAGGVPYFEHVLNPLQHSPPSYVLDLESGVADVHGLESSMPENVAGVVVVRLP